MKNRSRRDTLGVGGFTITIVEESLLLFSSILMLRPPRTPAFVWLLPLVLWVSVLLSSGGAQTLPQQKASPVAASGKKVAKKKVQPAVEVPQPPPPPPTLEQQPPTPPQVTYRDGQLTINSSNATLSQVLRSVQSQTGAVIDLPPGAGSERVVASLGPGKPQNVLASLLNGSKFNYVILGQPDDPGAVQKVILLAKSNAPSGESSTPVAQNNFRPLPPQPQPVEPAEEEYNPPEAEIENQGQLQPGQASLPGSENLTPDQINANPAGRTPEQLLQDLQRMQQQQQQMQQQLNPANQQPFNQQVPQQVPGAPQPQLGNPPPQPR